MVLTPSMPDSQTVLDAMIAVAKRPDDRARRMIDNESIPVSQHLAHSAHNALYHYQNPLLWGPADMTGTSTRLWSSMAHLMVGQPPGSPVHFPVGPPPGPRLQLPGGRQTRKRSGPAAKRRWYAQELGARCVHIPWHSSLLRARVCRI